MNLVEAIIYIIAGIIFLATGGAGVSSWRQSSRRDDKVTAQDARIADLETQISTIEKLKSTLETNGEALEALTIKQASEIQDLKDKMKEESTAKDAKIADLEAKNEGLTQRVNSLERSEMAKDTEIAKLKSDLVIVYQQRDQLTNEVKDLKDQLKSTRDEMLVERGKNEAYRSTLTTFAEKLTLSNGDKLGTDELKPVSPPSP